MRVFFTIVLPLLLPTLLYALYVLVARRRTAGPEGETRPEAPYPWVWLGVAGTVLAAVTFFAVAQLDGAPPGSHYQPAKVINGKIKPGRFD